MFYKRVGTGMVALSLLLIGVSTQPALSQSKMQTPGGHQTVAPSDMPQQPSITEELQNKSKMYTKTAPSPVLDQPGMPTFQPSNEKLSKGPIVTPRQAQNGAAKPGMPQNKSQVKGNPVLTPGSEATAPGGTPQPGALVMPQGEPSTVRVGPMEPTPIWARAILGVVLLFQFLMMSIIGVALHINKTRNDDLYQGGKIINEDYREPPVDRLRGAA
jgi:hypothetical protein